MNPRTLTIFTIAINTNLVPPDQEPKTWLDVLDPKWKGKVAMDDPRGSGPGGTILSGLDYLYGQDNNGGARADIAAAVLLGMATFSKPPNALLIAPLVLLLWWRRRVWAGLVVGAVFDP